MLGNWLGAVRASGLCAFVVFVLCAVPEFWLGTEDDIVVLSSSRFAVLGTKAEMQWHINTIMIIEIAHIEPFIYLKPCIL